METKILEMTKGIKSWCDAKDSCDDCVFYDTTLDSECELCEKPYHWDLPTLPPQTFTELAKKIIEEQGISLEKLDEKADVGINSLTSIINGEYYPTHNQLRKILSALEINPADYPHIFEQKWEVIK